MFVREIIIPFYYSWISQGISAVLKPDEKIFNAKKAINYAIKFLELFSNPTTGIWIHTSVTTVYSILINSYSILLHFAQSQEEQNEYKNLLIDVTRQCESIVKNDNIGLNKSNTNRAIIQAYKTLARITDNKEEKINMLKNAIQALEKNMEYVMAVSTGLITAKHMLGTGMIELGILTKNIETIKKARDIFLSMLNESNDKSFFYFTVVAQENIAQIEDRLSNHATSAMYYEEAEKSRKKLLKYIEYLPLQKSVKDMIKYNEAWKHIEEAKAHHKRENHLKAKDSYQKAYLILKELPKFNFESTYYEAWASLERAEHLSKGEKQKEAIEQYEKTRMDFEEVIDVLRKVSTQLNTEEDIKRIHKLEKVAKVRMDYCSARINLENARILSRQGAKIVAAEQFALVASQFRNICSVFKIERERKELEAIYYLCRAWETMELAEKFVEPDRFAEAATLFTKGSDLFSDSKYKLLASGNSAFCKALEYGCFFDESLETQLKGQLYSKVKMMLNNAATSYRKAGFDNGTKWILATSTYFDAIWNLIRANAELNLEERKKLLGIGSRYLNSAAELFSRAGYEEKEKEVKEHILMVEQEERILVTALGIITKPVVSSSTFGISAPTCPIEIGKATDINEAQTVTTESLRVQDRLHKEEGEKFPELVNEEPVVILILSAGGVPLFSYPFAEEWKFDDVLFGGFLSSFNSISDEIFSEGLDRARFGQYTVLMESVENFLVCYLFKGQVFLAKDKLKKFIERMQGNTIIWQTLNKFFQTGQVLEVKDVPIIEDLLAEIFIQS